MRLDLQAAEVFSVRAPDGYETYPYVIYRTGLRGDPDNLAFVTAEVTVDVLSYANPEAAKAAYADVHRLLGGYQVFGAGGTTGRLTLEFADEAPEPADDLAITRIHAVYHCTWASVQVAIDLYVS